MDQLMLIPYNVGVYSLGQEAYFEPKYYNITWMPRNSLPISVMIMTLLLQQIF